MATFSNTGIGGIKACGCALITYCKTYLTLYAPGDITYNIHKAKKGILEKAVIKKHKIINENRTGGIFQVMYVDTLNGLWNEWDLISHSQAISLATSYYEGLLEDASNLKC